MSDLIIISSISVVIVFFLEIVLNLKKKLYFCNVFYKRHIMLIFHERICTSKRKRAKYNYLRSMRYKRRLLHKIVKAVQSLFVIWQNACAFFML